MNLSKIGWNEIGEKKILSTGHELNAPELLFEKIEDDIIEKQVEKLHRTKDANKPAGKMDNKTDPVTEAKANIAYDDFGKMDIRIGTITAAERVPKTDKLLKLTIDTGNEQRTVVSGIAHCYEPDNIIGQQVTLLANLEPRKIKGIESKGMILMAEDQGKLVFVQPKDVINPGSKVS